MPTVLYDAASIDARSERRADQHHGHRRQSDHQRQHEQNQQTHARRHVRLSDQRLADLASAVTRSINWDDLRASSAHWDKKRVRSSGASDDFTLYAHRRNDTRYVMATTTVACSVTEMRNILRATTDAKYAAKMTELYGTNFVYGAVVHRSSSQAAGLSDARDRAMSRAMTSTSMSSAASSATGRGASCDVLTPDAYDVLVKTATFVKPHLFARNEQWCFIEHYTPRGGDSRTGFVLAMRSLHADDVFVGKTKGVTRQLQGVTAAYSVELDRVQRLVRVVFYAKISPSSGGAADAAHTSSASRSTAASISTLEARLTAMAKATRRLPLLVRRRRLGAQVFADTKALVPHNTRCVCCAKSLHVQQLLQTRKQCHLCGAFVCEPCSVVQHVKRSRVKRFAVRVCEHCLERVDEASYDNVPADGALPPSIRANAPDAPPAGKQMTTLLRETLASSPALRKPAVMKVIRYLVDDDDVDMVEPAAEPPSRDSTASAPVRERRPTVRLTEETPVHEYVRALETPLRVRETPLEQLTLANATSRTYPLAYKTGNAGVPHYPIPHDEQQRLAIVRQQRLAELTHVPELEVICLLASRELDCSVGLVTVMGAEHIHILASTEGFTETQLPREDVFCAHTIMSDAPVLIPHPEADIAYSRFPVVADGGLRFYFGFPLKAPDSTVVGTVCCLAHEPREVSQAQFAAVEKLAAAASRLLQARMQDSSIPMLA